MRITLTFEQLPLIDVSGPLLVNGQEFRPVGFLAATALYEGPNLSRVSFIRLPQPSSSELLPREFWANDERFVRRFETYYTAEYSGAPDVEALFDYLAIQYEQTIDKALNAQIIRLMFLALADYANTRHLPIVRILDFGCGTGLSWEILQSECHHFQCNVELLGCDFAESMVHVCRAKGFQASKSSYSRTPYLSRYFDAILCSFVVHYFMDVRPVTEIARVLRTPGIILYNAPRSNYVDLNYYSQTIPAILSASGRSVGCQSTVWSVHAAVTRHIPLYSCVVTPTVTSRDGATGHGDQEL